MYQRYYVDRSHQNDTQIKCLRDILKLESLENKSFWN